MTATNKSGKVSQKSQLEQALTFHLEAIGLEPVREYRFHPERRWRFDFAFPELSIGIEIHGGIFARGKHSRGAGQLKDMEKSNAANELGWTVLTYGPPHIRDGSAFEQIERTVRARLDAMTAPAQAA